MKDLWISDVAPGSNQNLAERPLLVVAPAIWLVGHTTLAILQNRGYEVHEPGGELSYHEQTVGDVTTTKGVGHVPP